MAGFRLTTKVQVSGWRFLLRRVEHAIVRRDTRMYDDPLQFYSRAVTAGLVVALLVCLGAMMMAYFKPLGTRGGENLLVDRTTNQLFVLLPGSGKLHPVYNLTSARLVLGHATDPVAVKSQELDRMPKGQPIGIPGAPYATPVAGGTASTWSLCDTVVKADSVAPMVQTSVIAEPLATDSSVGPLPEGDGVVVRYGDGQWLVTKDGRHAIDPTDRAVASAVGIPVTVKAAPISRAMFNAIRDAGSWGLPPIVNAGAPNSVGLPPNLVIGSVFEAVTGEGHQQYVVLADGVAKVNGTTAAALRATNSYGLVEPPQVESSTVAAIPERVYASPLPANPMNIVDRVSNPVLCWSWQRQAGDQSPLVSIIAGRHLPLPPAALNSGVEQVTGDNTVFIDGGQYIRLQAPDPRAGESLYYVDPQGVRYGVPNPQVGGELGLSSPQNAPWQVVSLLVDGPVLSKDAALLEHDTLPPDPSPRRVEANQGSGS